jgi:hypothetical protein
MERNEHYNDRNYNQFDDYGSQGRGNESYSQRGNYYGIHDSNYGHGNVRMQQRPDFNDFSQGPVGGYGAGNYNDTYNRTHRNRDDHYRYGDDSHFKQSHGYSSGDTYRTNDYRSEEYRNRDYRNRSNEGQDYSSGLPYSSNYDVAGNRRYARQENSYQNPGHGRRYSEFGQDEKRNYSHELTDIHHDRGRIPDSSENDYRGDIRPSNAYDFDEDKEDFRYSGRIVDAGSDRDTYASGLYSSNRAYVSDHSESDSDRFNTRSNRSRRSGPDYSKSSPITGYSNESFGL